jgi:hypothetical protein
MDRLASIAAFVRVVENGGFTAAARHLNLSPTIVGNHVQELAPTRHLFRLWAPDRPQPPRRTRVRHAARGMQSPKSWSRLCRIISTTDDQASPFREPASNHLTIDTCLWHAYNRYRRGRCIVTSEDVSAAVPHRRRRHQRTAKSLNAFSKVSRSRDQRVVEAYDAPPPHREVEQ